MQKKGMTLIEVVISVTLIGIILVTVATIIAALTKDLTINGERIEDFNVSKGKLERTANFIVGDDEGDAFVNEDDSITRQIKWVDVLGSRVETTYIEVKIEDVSGNDTGEIFYIYDTPRALPIEIGTDGEPENADADPFWDFNSDGIFNEDDYVIEQLSSSNNRGVINYTNTADEGTLVFRKGDVYFTELEYIDIGENNIVFNEGANLTIAKMTDENSTIICKDFTMTNATFEVTSSSTGTSPRIEPTGNVKIDSSGIYAFGTIYIGQNSFNDGSITTESIEIINGSTISSENSGVKLQAKNITAKGTNDKITQIKTSNKIGEVNEIWFKADNITYGDISQNKTDSYVHFSTYNGYAYNYNGNGIFTNNSVPIKIFDIYYFK